MKTIFVGNLPFAVTESDVSELFGQFGTVCAVRLITDRETGRPRGFGFVEMAHEHAVEAIEKLNGQEFQGRPLRVHEAQPRGGA